MNNIRLKWVMRADSRTRLFRVVRLMWIRGTVGPRKGGYSAKLSLALSPRLVRWARDRNEWQFTLLGVRVHYIRSYGGIIV